MNTSTMQQIKSLFKSLTTNLESKQTNKITINKPNYISTLDITHQILSFKTALIFIYIHPNFRTSYFKHNFQKILQKATEQGNLQIIQTLFEIIKPPINFQINPPTLFLSIKNNHLHILKYLTQILNLTKEHFNPINEYNNKYNTTNKIYPITLACETGNLELLKYLIETLHLDLKSDEHNTYYCTIKLLHIHILEYLITLDENHKHNIRQSLSVYKGEDEEKNLTMIKFLHETVKMNYTFYFEDTATHAIKNGYLKTAEYLFNIVKVDKNVFIREYIKTENYRKVCDKGNIKIIKFMWKVIQIDIEQLRSTYDYANRKIHELKYTKQENKLKKYKKITKYLDYFENK